MQETLVSGGDDLFMKSPESSQTALHHDVAVPHAASPAKYTSFDRSARGVC